MAGDSNFSGNTGEIDLLRWRQIFADLIADPTMFGFLERPIMSALQKVHTTFAGLPGGARMGFPGGSVFGPQDVGLNFADAMGQQSVLASSNPAQQALAKAQQNQAASFHQMLGMNPAEAAAAAKRPGFTNLLSSYVFEAMQPQGLLAGIQESSRYMGVGPVSFLTNPSLRAAQLGINEGAGLAAGSLADAFRTRPQDFGGLRGTDVGRIRAEQSRTGAFNAIDPSMGLDQRASEMTRMTQEASRAVSSFRQLFKGSVTDVLDQVNSLLGTDVLQTFGGQGQAMFNRAAATGAIAGFRPEQIVALTAGSRQLSVSNGMDPWGALSSATYSAQILGANRRGNPTGSKFVSEPRLRQTVLAAVTGAQESGISRDISGGYAMVKASGNGQEAAFLAAAGSASSSAEVAGLVQQFGGGSVSSFDLRNASFTPAAEEARLGGVGTTGALNARLGHISGTRQAIVNRVLANEGLGSISITGPLTTSNIGTALAGANMGTSQFAAVHGEIIRRFQQQAGGLPGSPNAFEVDALLGSVQNRGVMDLLQGQISGRVGLQDMFKNQGKLSGLLNLRSVAEAFGKGEKADYGKFIAVLTGQDPNGINVGKFFGFTADLEGQIKELGGKEQTIAKLGLSAITSAMFSGRLGDKALSTQDFERFRQVFVSGGISPAQRLALLNEAAQSADEDAIYGASVSELTASYQKQGIFGKDIKSEHTRAASRMMTLQQISALSGGGMASQLGEKDKKTFLGTAQNLRDYTMAQLRAKNTDISAITDAFFAQADHGGKDAQMRFIQQMRDEAELNDNVGVGVYDSFGGGLTGSILEALQGIWGILRDNMPTANANSPGTPVDWYK